MPITEGNPTDQQPAAPVIDYEAIGAAVARSIAPMQAPAAPVSAFQEAIKAIEADPDNDKETLKVLGHLFDAHKADLSKENKNEISKMLVQERVRQASQTLDAEINRMVESNDKLKDLAPAARILAIQEFDNSAEFNKHRAELLDGTLNPEVLRKLASKHFTKLSGAGEKGASGLTGMKSEGVSEAAAAQAANDAAGAPTVEGLNSRQRDLYYAILAENERVGKASGLTKEQSAKEALERASKKFR